MVSARGSCPEQNGRTGTLPWHESALEGGARRVSGADIRPRPNPRGLHRRSDFVDGDLASRLEHRAPFRQLDPLAQRSRLQDRVAGRPGAGRNVVDRPVTRDALRLRADRVARIDHRRPELAEPGSQASITLLRSASDAGGAPPPLYTSRK